MKYFVYIVIAIIAIAIVAGFFLVGSPSDERARRFDDQRVSDLQSIQGQIIYYWQNKGKLPAIFDDLKDPISGFVAAKDPETGAEYGYNVKGVLAFSLCANFNQPSTQQGQKVASVPAPMAYPYPGGNASNWDHPAGQYCFDRTIDPQLYKPRPLQQ